MRIRVLGLLFLISAALFFTGNAVAHNTVASTAPPTLLASNQAGPDSLVVDSQTVYWANCGTHVTAVPISQPLQFGAIIHDQRRLSYTSDITFTRVSTTYLPLILITPRAPTDGAILAFSKGQGISQTLASGLSCPYFLKADTDSLFWLSSQWIAGGRVTIFRMPKSGGQPVELTSYEAINDSLAVDETYVYWRENSGVVMRLPKTGSGTPQPAPVPALVFDGPDAYWLNSNNDLIRSGKDGSSAVTLVRESDLAKLGIPGDSAVYITAIFPKPSEVYFTVFVDNNPGITGCRDDFTVLMEISKGGGEYGRVAWAAGYPMALVTEPFVYFSGGGCIDGIIKITLNTQTVENVVKRPESACALADDAMYVYWADYTNGWIKRVDK